MDLGSLITLLEAAIAFALTMLAMSLGVSVVCAMMAGAMRWRQKLLLETLEYFFRNTVVPSLQSLQTLAPGAAPDSGPSGSDRLAFWTRTPPQLLYGFPESWAWWLYLLLGRPFRRVYRWAKGPQAQADDREAAPPQPADIAIDERPLRMFVTDMAQTPATIAPAAEAAAPSDADSDGDSPRHDARDAARPLDKVRYVVRGLSAEEVATRLRASRLGESLSRVCDAATVEATFESWTTQFRALQAGRRERFQRRMTGLSLAVTVLLVAVTNFDAIALLRSYMTDDAARRTAIARIESQLDDVVQATPDRPAEAPAESASAALEELFQRVADDPAYADLAEDGRLQAAKAVLEDAAERAGAYREVAAEAAQAAAFMTEAFPIGWDHYPNCTPGAPDPRCARLAEHDGTAACAERSGALARVACAFTCSTSAFVLWLVGLGLSIGLIGLGAPFWVEVSKSLLRARGLLRGDGGSESQTKARSVKA